MSSVQRATTLLKLKPYKIPVVQIRDCDFVTGCYKRKTLENWMQKIFFSDEAWFYLHGQVYSQNYRYYSDLKSERVFGSSGSRLLLRVMYE